MAEAPSKYFGVVRLHGAKKYVYRKTLKKINQLTDHYLTSIEASTHLRKTSHLTGFCLQFR